MKKQLLKSALIAVAGVGLLAGSAMANPVVSGDWQDYEYFQATGNGQAVAAGDSFTFNFDLANSGTETSTSSLVFKTDVTGYGPTLKPVSAVWAAISIYDTDALTESFQLFVQATYNSIIYDLGLVTVSVGPNTVKNNQIFEFSGDLLAAWQNDPSGTLAISVTNNSGNNFKLKEVGIGVSAVPEPATMLLFGTGIAGLAGIARRRKN